MRSPNSFREIQEEREFEFEQDEMMKNQIQAEVSGTLGLLRFIGQIVEMYLPKVVDVIVAASGGKPNKNQDKYSDAPSLGGINRPDDIKPGNPDNE